MAISAVQRAQCAYSAGFRGLPLQTIVAISLCECAVGSSSGCETGCVPDCCPAAPSCGIVQVYQGAHPGTAAQASTCLGAMQLAWSISSHGADFHPWTTYNNGCYLGQMNAAAAAIAAAHLGAPAPPPPPPPVLCPPGYTQSGGVCIPPPGQITPILAAAGEGAAIALLGVIVGGVLVGGAWYDAKRKGTSLRRELDYEWGRVKASRRAGEVGRLPVSVHV